jgi:hypothetical protein
MSPRKPAQSGKPSASGKSSQGAMQQLTLRMTADQMAFVGNAGKESPTENIRAIIEDARLLYGLPSLIVEKLVEGYSGNRKLDLSRYEDRRELIIRTLTEHYTHLVTRGRDRE